jgi:hypothetical protein
MVRKVRKYANGGQVTDHTSSDYRFPKPTYGEAVKDRVKGFFTSGAAGRAAKKVSGSGDGARKRRLDKAIEDMSG